MDEQGKEREKEFKDSRLHSIRKFSADLSNLPKKDKLTVKTYVRNNTADQLVNKAFDASESGDSEKAKLYSTAATVKTLAAKGGRKTRKHKKRRSSRRRKHM
jgi:hypothetical protein